ncbi:MAG: hypothetical protein V4724_26840 [Pseudomonadota bacterium]
MTLTGYLTARGSRMLTPAEARAFGIPHPLERGWMEKYADMDLTMVKLQALFMALDGNTSRPAHVARKGLLAAATHCLQGESRLSGNVKNGMGRARG